VVAVAVDGEAGQAERVPAGAEAAGARGGVAGRSRPPAARAGRGAALVDAPGSPGTSTDIEFADGYLASAGHIALLPHGEALTYQHCVSAVQQAASQSEPLSEIAPTSRSSLCASGSGGDLASIRVTHDDGSSLTVNITVWEYV
jgi:hypothetical protein